MSTYQVKEAQEARRLEAKGDKPELVIDHLTLEANGSEVLATAFRRPTTPLPAVGSTLEGELGDPDNFDKGRRKFKKAQMGGGGMMRKRDPGESRRIERQHSQHMALLYVQIKAEKGWIEGFDLSDVAKITDAFDRDLDPTAVPKSEVPADTEGLPSLNDPI